MLKEKFIAIFRFLCLLVPFYIVGGLELIMIHNKNVKCHVFEITSITKKRKKIDKDKFAKMMNRITK